MNVARGRCPFDSTCLKSGLSTNADALDFREYLAFYGLDNLMHLESHEVQVLNVPIDGGQNIVVQTFKPAHHCCGRGDAHYGRQLRIRRR